MKSFSSILKVTVFCAVTLIASKTFAQDDDQQSSDTFPKIRLGFYSHTNSYRQILIGFEDGIATDGIDPGFDAINTFNLPNDMYFWCQNTELFIQGVSAWQSTGVYPIGVRSNGDGDIIIKLDATENMDPNQSIYIYDSLNNTYTSLKSGNFTTTLGSGTFNDRFSLRFINQSTLGVDNPTLNTGMKVNYIGNENMLNITNTLTDTTAENVYVYSMSGQQVATWNASKENQSEMNIPVNGLSSGAYIVNVKTTTGTISKKIAIR